jgi:four helix bundle protein
MGAEQLKKRTQEFGISIIKLMQIVPDRGPAQTICRQLLRCGTSVGANFRATCRARSRSDFIAKLKIVEEEADESAFWLEILEKLDLSKIAIASVKDLPIEANQILSIIVSSIKTVRRNSI